MVFSCSEDDNLANENNLDSSRKRNSKRDPIPRDCTINIDELSDKDKLKQTLAKFVNDALADESLRRYLISNLYNDTRDGDNVQNPEFLIASHLNDKIRMKPSATFGIGSDSEATLNDLLMDWVEINDPDQLELFQSLCSQYSNLVLKFPWWSVEIINEIGINNIELGSIGSIEPIECDGVNVQSFFHGDEEEIINVSMPLANFIPIYVKESELYFNTNNNPQALIDEMIESLNLFYEDGCSFSNSQLMEFIETIDCSNIDYLDYVKMSAFFDKHCTLRSTVRTPEICCDGIDNDENGLTDWDDIEVCPRDVEICNDGCDNDDDGLIDEDCPCVGQYQRDCVAEDNVLVGIKFGEDSWRQVCQLPDEDFIDLLFDFSAVLICDDQSCALDELSDFKVGKGIEDFFEVQVFYSTLNWSQSDRDDIVWESEDGNQFWKVFPRYFALRGKYLYAKQNQWIPTDIGSKINFSVIEQDVGSVTASETITNTVSSTHGFTANGTAGISELLSTNFSYNFSSTEVSAAVNATSINYQKDVLLNYFDLLYWEKDEVISDPTGVTNNTWYGHVPGNTQTGGDIIYLEFRIHD